MTDTKFWLSDYKILLNNLSFFPNGNMSRNELLNSLTRYSILIFLVFLFISSNSNWLYLPLGIFISCILLYLIDIPRQENDKNLDIENEKNCREPNINNPYMNILVTQDNVEKPACDNEKVKDLSKKFFKYNLYQNSSDIFEKKNFERQFYTMPVSTIPSKQNDFVDWLYKKDSNCKSDGVDCLEYEDERYH